MAALILTATFGPATHEHQDTSPTSSCVLCQVAPDAAPGAAEISLEVRPRRIAAIYAPAPADAFVAGGSQNPAHGPRAPPVSPVS